MANEEIIYFYISIVVVALGFAVFGCASKNQAHVAGIGGVGRTPKFANNLEYEVAADSILARSASEMVHN